MISLKSKISGTALAELAIVVVLVIPAASFLLLKLPPTPTLRAQENIRRAGAWLDRPVVNWNRKSRELPSPVLPVDQEDVQTRCPDLLRQAASPPEREIVHAGWLLYGPVHSYGRTRVMTAMSGADSLCRPLGYQAFVYFANTYGGTLSPVAMDSLTNGALTTIRLVNATNISAEFARYRKQDLPCCPTRMSYVTYEASDDDAPLARPVEIVTKSLCPSDTRVPENPSYEAPRLFEVKWRLTEMKGVALRSDNPYIRFERAAKIFSGNGGCNQIAGGFEIEGTNLTFLRVVSTRMACLDSEAQQLETDFVKALEQVTRFQLQDDILRLYDCGSLLLVFQPDASEVGRTPQEARVTGTRSSLCGRSSHPRRKHTPVHQHRGISVDYRWSPQHG